VVWWRHDKRHVHWDGLTQGLGAKGTRGAHVEHGVHVRDAGGVEAQRLVEGRRGLPSRGEGMRCEGERCEPGGGRRHREAAHKRHARGRPHSRLTQGLRAKGTRGERTKNMRFMVVTLEVSKLSGWLKADACCRVEGRACDAGGRGASREAGGPVWCGGGTTSAACTGNARLKACGGQGHARRAHVEHVAHGRDAGGVEAQRLVERPRVLPSRREGMRCGGGRGASREAGGRGVHGGGTQEACTGPDLRPGGQGHARSTRRTWSAWS